MGNGSYPDRWRLEEEINVQKAANELQKENNRKIRAELDDAKSGNDAIEERARSELGMTRKGETFYEVVLQPDPIISDVKNKKPSEKPVSSSKEPKKDKSIDE